MRYAERRKESIYQILTFLLLTDARASKTVFIILLSIFKFFCAMGGHFYKKALKYINRKKYKAIQTRAVGI